MLDGSKGISQQNSAHRRTNLLTSHSAAAPLSRLYTHRLVANPALAEIPSQVLTADLHMKRANGTTTAEDLRVARRGIVHNPRLLMPPDVVICRRRHHHAPEWSLALLRRRVAGRRVRGDMAADIKVVLRLALLGDAPTRAGLGREVVINLLVLNHDDLTAPARRCSLITQHSALLVSSGRKNPCLISAISFSRIISG